MTIADRPRRRAAAATMTAGGIAIAGGLACAGLVLPASAGPAAATSPATRLAAATSPATRLAAATSPATGPSPAAYNFRTLASGKDAAFNQLLDINSSGLMAGCSGSGAQGHPSKGYLLAANGSYASQNFPGSVQTQVTGLNDKGGTVGFWSGMNTASQVNDNHGWWSADGKHFHLADYPASSPASPPVDQLLGINNAGLAVGFYTDAAGDNHGYSDNTKTGRLQLVTFSSTVDSPSITATAINNDDDIAGFYADSAGNIDSFLSYGGGGFTTLRYPGATSTQALGVNDRDEVVGAYTDGSGSSATTHGFTWKPRDGFAPVDDPDGAGTTTVSGVNNSGDIVGFYVGGSGGTDGFEATPVTSKLTLHLRLAPMPQGQLVISAGKVKITGYGFTPGSSHQVAITVAGIQAPVGTLTASAAGSVSRSYALPAATVASRRGQGRAGVHHRAASPSTQLVILNAGQGSAVIAQSPAITGPGAYPVQGVEPGHGVIRPGSTTLVYDPATGTISVTVSATGLAPGAHAAHIHVGSCRQEGRLAYPLPDFTASPRGVISNQTRTVTGVGAVELSGGWYLNLHQGNSGSIVSKGQPAMDFRPLECADI